MITLVTPSETLDVRADRPSEVSQAHSRFVSSLPRTGVFLVEGDAGWDPALLTLRVRVSDPNEPAAVQAWRDLLRVARETVHLELHDSTIPIYGLSSAESVHRGTWWDVTLRFVPYDLRGARPLSGAGEPPPPDEDLPYLMVDVGVILVDEDDTPFVWTEE